MLQDKIQEDLKNAQLERDNLKVSTLRMLLSEVNYAKIAKSNNLSDDDIIAVVQKEIKKRREAAMGFRQGGREDSARKEEQELKVLEGYLPPQLSDEELTDLVQEAINAVGAKTISDMGKVMGMVMGKVGKAAEPGRVSGIVKDRLMDISRN